MGSFRVLLTGFEPFDGAAINESWEAVSLIAGRRRTEDDGDLVTARLPVTFGGAARRVAALIAEQGPFDAILNVGLDATATGIKLERLAVNLADARIPDNAGDQPVDRPLDPAGPSAYWTRLPVREAETALRAAEIPVQLSYSAGTYVCNSVFYSLLNSAPGQCAQAGFVHVPPARVMAVEDVAAGLEVVIAACRGVKPRQGF
ncbi:MAG: pyroglutamyl-peptidase I [Promicromonosporaceae bacterium]|nr:pyroglutamyl-peptidase I [Promicromonosporaceae bacterium]